MSDDPTLAGSTSDGRDHVADVGSVGDSPDWLPATGTIIAGCYEVGRVIGAGGMGAVVAAKDVQHGEAVALKFLHKKLANAPASLERFVREAHAAARIKSEHVVSVLDVGTTESGLPFIVMELLEGGDLGSAIADGPLPIEAAVDYVLQACEALAEAHVEGIVHRDIKPSNLWLARRSDGTPLVKVLDFGISKLAPEVAGPSKVTTTAAVFGSPSYMSPQQIRSAKRVDARTDVWAIGIVLHELLTCRLPFEGENTAGILAAITADPPVPLRSVRPDAPEGLERAILLCLEKDASRRIDLVDLAARLKPFASPIGIMAADRVSRIGPPMPSLLVAPASSAPDANAAASHDLTFAAPEKPLGAGRRRSVLLAIAAVTSMAIASFALWWREPSLPPPSVQVSPSPPPTPAPTPATAEPDPARASATVSSETPSVDASAPAASQRAASTGVRPPRPPAPRSTVAEGRH